MARIGASKPMGQAGATGQDGTRIAIGGRQPPFHAGRAADEIGGLGEALILGAGVGAAAQAEGFAEELYAALCNTAWKDRHGRTWCCTWRCAADVAAIVRGRPDDDFRTFFEGGGEGRVSDRIRREIERLRWTQII